MTNPARRADRTPLGAIRVAAPAAAARIAACGGPIDDVAPTIVAPTIVACTPMPGATNVWIGSPIVVRSSDPMRTASIALGGAGWVRVAWTESDQDLTPFTFVGFDLGDPSLRGASGGHGRGRVVSRTRDALARPRCVCELDGACGPIRPGRGWGSVDTAQKRSRAPHELLAGA